VAAEVGDVLKAVYIAMDEAVGRILQNLGENAVGVVLFTHGIEQGYSGTRLLDRILASLENGPGHNAFNNAVKATARKVWCATWHAAPTPIKEILDPIRKKAKTSSFYNLGFQPYRNKRKFFEVLVNERNSGVRINLAGREREGIVQPGREYDELCDYLQEELAQVVKKDSGEPAFLRIIKVHDQFRGEVQDRLPDLVVTWNRKTRITTVTSPKIGSISHNLQMARTGDHHPVGMFVATGAGVEQGHLNQKVDIIDFAPTIAGLVGSNPDAFKGEVINALTSVTSESMS
jgi:predicted AlkP superfamily phosphohydrolase/phosphomutase